MHHTPSFTATFSRSAVRALDRAAIDELGIPGIVLMENAAAAIEEAAVSMLAAGSQEPQTVLICCAHGNNGGDGLALARRLHNHGIEVIVLLVSPRERFAADALTNLRIVERLGVPMHDLDARTPSATLAALLDRHGTVPLIVDALFGTGLDRPLTAPITAVIQWISTLRSQGSLVLAVDIPSGLDCDTGRPIGEAAVVADVTITLAGRKQGFDAPESRAWTGRVIVGDIGVPPALLRRFDQQ